jgi:tetratricopeptide (TPR) repeat protein
LSLLLTLTALGATPSAHEPTNTPAAPPSLLRPGATNSPSVTEPTLPTSPREFYDAGTRQLIAGKLPQAEASLATALASQDQQIRPTALYNIGLVRFGQGVEQLKKGPAAKPTVARGERAAHQGDEAIRQAEEALASDDVQRMVSAYMRGRGTRKELKAATEAVRRALQVYGTVLDKWERASGDFKSASELNAADLDARRNAKVLDQSIAKLVDSVREMQQCSNGTCSKNQQLADALKKLKGRIPKPNMSPGEAGDEEEEQEQKPQPGQQEGPSKDGQEMTLSPEQAAWLLDSYRLDSERRLPMGEAPGQPKERSRLTW